MYCKSLKICPPPLFACYFEQKWGGGVPSNIRFVLTIHPPPASSKIESIVCGHHVYNAVWSPYIGKSY